MTIYVVKKYLKWENSWHFSSPNVYEDDVGPFAPLSSQLQYKLYFQNGRVLYVCFSMHKTLHFKAINIFAAAHITVAANAKYPHWGKIRLVSYSLYFQLCVEGSSVSSIFKTSSTKKRWRNVVPFDHPVVATTTNSRACYYNLKKMAQKLFEKITTVHYNVDRPPPPPLLLASSCIFKSKTSHLYTWI